MVSRITNTRIEQQPDSGVWVSSTGRTMYENQQKRDSKILQNEAKMSFRINKTAPEKAQNEAN
jgi:hypothetical protein